MTKKQFYILLMFFTTVVLLITNPSEENHIQTVKTKLKVAFKRKMSSEISNQDNVIESLGNGIGLLFGDTIIDKLTDGIVSRENYFIFSLTNASYKGDNKIIGFGILGNVFISDKIENIFQSNNKTEETKEYTMDEPVESAIEEPTEENNNEVVNRTDSDNKILELLKDHLIKQSNINEEVNKVYINSDGDLQMDDKNGNFLSVYGLKQAEIFSGDVNNDNNTESIIVVVNSGGGGGGNIEIVENYLFTKNNDILEIDKNLINAPKNKFGYNIYLTGIENDFVIVNFVYRNEEDGFYAQGKEVKLRCKMVDNKLVVKN